MSEADLENRLFVDSEKTSSKERPLPDWADLHKEISQRKVKLTVAWTEYKMEHPDGYQYSQFCELYRRWKKSLDLCLRQEHKAGEKLFVDYCGETMAITDPSNGKTREVEIFVATWGASNFTFAEATETQQLHDWIGSHERALRFFGGSPEIIVPDNLRSGISRACRYEPDENPMYHDFAKHYGIAVIPARVKKPKDKAKVEKGVQFVEDWIIARLRKQTFFSLAELNRAIRELLDELNNRPMQKIDETRRSLFEKLDKPALKPLPPHPYEYMDWKKARVGSDYHVELDYHFYSVPHRFARQKVDVRYNEKTVELFHRGERIACHRRSQKKGGCTTLREHMPEPHQAFYDWTPDKLREHAEGVGSFTARLVKAILIFASHPLQGARSCLGILRLEKSYGCERLERACERALRIQAFSYKSVQSILKNGLDNLPPPESPTDDSTIQHDNIRGSKYYH
jgi:transposase